VITLAPFGPESSTLQPEMTFLASVAHTYGRGALAAIVASDGEGALAGALAIRQAGGSIVATDTGPRPYGQAIASIIGGGQWDQVVPRDELALAIKVRVLGRKVLRDTEVIGELDRMLEGLLSAQGSTMGNIQLVDRDAGVLRLVAQRGFDERFARRFGKVGLEEDCVETRAVRENRRVVVADVEGDPCIRPYVEEVLAAGYRSAQSTPVCARGVHLVGVVSTHYPRVQDLTPSRERVLDEFAANAGEVVAAPLGH
jgi:GAF domain